MTVASDGEDKYGFYNRENLIVSIKQASPGNLLSIHGEKGIGKSRLLKEAARQVKIESPGALAAIIDFETISVPEGQRPLAIGEAFYQAIIGTPAPKAAGAEELAREAVKRAAELGRSGKPVFLMVDTTEKFQDDIAFWQWLEENLVSPLLTGLQVRLVFSGKIPAPWRRWEVRRSIKQMAIDPLPCETDASDLAREVLERGGAHPGSPLVEQMVRLVIDFSCGHPELTRQLAEYVAEAGTEKWNDAIREQMCRERVEPFINRTFFEGIDQTWKEILWWASVLNWFDPAILRRYLSKANPPLGSQSDWFYIDGINMLRVGRTVMWRQAEGDRLRGVIREIVQQCLRVLHPDDYNTALRAAYETFTEIAKELEGEESEAKIYADEASRFAVAV